MFEAGFVDLEIRKLCGGEERMSNFSAMHAYF